MSAYGEMDHRDCQMAATSRLEDGTRDTPYLAAEAQVWATLAVAAAIKELADAVDRANRPAPRR